MKEPHLEVQANALHCTDALGHQQAVAKSEHGVDGIAGWTSRPRRELQATRRDGLTDGAKVDPGRITLNTPDMVCRVGASQSSDPLPDLCTASRELFSFGRIRLIP